MKLRRLLVPSTLLILAITPALARDLSALSVVPADSVTVGVVRVAELRNSPLARRIFSHTDRITMEGEADRFLTEAGLSPMEDVDTVVFSLSPSSAEDHDGNPLLVLEGRFDPERLSKAMADRGAVRVLATGGTYYRFTDDDPDRDDRLAVALVSSSLTLAGREDAVIEALEAYSRGGTDFANAAGLAHLLGKIDPDASAWLLVDVPRSTRLKGETEVPGRNDAIQAAMKNVSVVALWADDNGSDLRLGGTAQSNDAETLTLLEDLLRGMLATWRLAAQEKAPELVSEIRKFGVSRSGDSVTLSGEISADVIERFANRGRHAHGR